jgi:hypothetical protein
MFIKQSPQIRRNRSEFLFYIYEYHRENLIRGKAPNDSWQKYEYDTAGRLIYVRDDTGWIQQSNEYASSRQRLASGSYASVDITYYAWGGSSVLAEYSTQFSSSSLCLSSFINLNSLFDCLATILLFLLCRG